MKGVIGIDEVGRGPLAGPVTVCAVYIEDQKRVLKDIFKNSIRDSKSINKSLRNNIYQTIRYKRYLNTRIEYTVISRNAAFIDTHGISKAIQECLNACIRSLEKKGIKIDEVPIRLDAGLVVRGREVNQASFIKGDERYTEIALASILAKESRDAYMRRLSTKHGSYGWERNAGYGTKEHRSAIEKSGTTKYHRMSYLKAFKLFEKPE